MSTAETVIKGTILTNSFPDIQPDSSLHCLISKCLNNALFRITYSCNKYLKYSYFLNFSKSLSVNLGVNNSSPRCGVLMGCISITIYQGYICTEKFFSNPRSTEEKLESINKYPGLMLSICQQLEISSLFPDGRIPGNLMYLRKARNEPPEQEVGNII